MTQFESPARWYLIQTKPRQEARAEEHLQRQQFECYRPLKPGETKKHASSEALFPGYLFIRMDQLHDNWYPIRSTRGVSRIVTFGGYPAPVPDAMIEQIRQRLATPAPKAEFRQGEPVLVRAAESCDIEAIFLTRDGDERAVILLNLLQREQKVTLPISSLSRMQTRV